MKHLGHVGAMAACHSSYSQMLSGEEAASSWQEPAHHTMAIKVDFALPCRVFHLPWCSPDASVLIPTPCPHSQAAVGMATALLMVSLRACWFALSRKLYLKVYFIWQTLLAAPEHPDYRDLGSGCCREPVVGSAYHQWALSTAHVPLDSLLLEKALDHSKAFSA